MPEPIHGPKDSPSDLSPPGSSGSAVEVDRQADGAAVVRFLRAAGGKVVVLHGRRGAGKSELIHRWVVPLLAAESRVLQGECTPDLPATLVSPEGAVPMDWAALPSGTVLLDDFDQFLALPERTRREGMAKVVGALRAAQSGSTLVLVVGDDSLRDIFALRAEVPEVTDNLFELPEVALETGLTKLAAREAEAHGTYTPRLLEELRHDLDQFSLRTPSPDLIQTIHTELRRQQAGDAEAANNLAIAYSNAGGLKGLLDGFVDRKLEELAKAAGPEAKEAGRAALEEIVLKTGHRIAPSLPEIALRLGLPVQTVTDAVAWLTGPQGCLGGTLSGRLDLRPIQLVEIIAARSEFRRREARQIQRSLTEATRMWLELGSVLPRERFDRLHQARQDLQTTAEEAVLMTYCALRYANGEDLAGPRYWIKRIPEPSARIRALVQALADEAPDTRRRAALLAANHDLPEDRNPFDVPEIRNQLYRTALEDPDPAVRRQAVDSLGRLDAAEFRDRLEGEADDAASPFRSCAVRALRIFPDDRTSTDLQKLVNDPNTETAVRSVAIETLAALQTPAAVEALVNIGLNDEDKEDRTDALAALATLESEPLQAAALTKIRMTRVEVKANQEPFRVSTVPLAIGRLFLAFLVVIANWVLHGFALATLGRFRWAAAFFAAEIVAVACCVVGTSFEFFGIVMISVVALYLNLFFCQIMAFKLATSEKSVQRRFGFRRFLRVALFLANAFSVGLWFHGGAHLMVKETRRGWTLFVLGLLGLACFGLAQSYQGLFDVANHQAAATGRFWWVLLNLFRWLYLGGSLVLFLGSYFWDLVFGAWLAFRPQRHATAAERQAQAYGKMLVNHHAARVVLASLQSERVGEVRWANRLVRQFADRIPWNLMVECLARQGTRTPRCVMRALKSVKQEDFLRAVHELWQKADAGMRHRIWQVLAARPTESSLRYLKQLQPAAGLFGYCRYFTAALDYRIRVWPKTVLVVAAMLFPLAAVFMHEGSLTFKNEAHPLLRSIRSEASNLCEPGAIEAFAFLRKHSELQQKVAKTARFLADLYPAQSAEPLGGVLASLDRSTNNQLNGVREAVSESLGIIVAKEASKAQEPGLKALTNAQELALKALTNSLARSTNHPQRVLAPAKGLAQIVKGTDSETVHHRRARDAISSVLPSLEAILLSQLDSKSKEDVLEVLGTLGSSNAVTIVKEFIIKPGTSSPRWIGKGQSGGKFGLPETASAERQTELEQRELEQRELEKGLRELQLRALTILSQMGNRQAHSALLEAATGAESKEIQSEAGLLAQRMWANRLAEAQEAMGRRDLRRAYRLGLDGLEADLAAPEKANWLALVGEVCYERSKAETNRAPSLENEALKHLEQARRQDPLQPQAGRLLAKVHTARAGRLLEAKSYGPALQEAKNALETDPQSQEAYGIQAEAQLEMDDRQGALRTFAQAVTNVQAQAWAYYWQAKIHYDQTNYARAEELALQAVEADPNYGATFPLLVWIYDGQGRASEAARLFENLVAKYPTNTYPRQELAYLYHERVAKTDRTAYERAYQINKQLLEEADNPAEKEAIEANFAENNLTTGRYKEAVSLARKVAKRSSDANNRVAMGVIAYAALVAERNGQAARKELDSLERACQARSGDTETGWIFDGTLGYLRNTDIPEPMKPALVRLVEAINEGNKKKRAEVPQSLIQENRVALRSPMVRTK